MSSNKAALKAAKIALDAHKYEAAATEARKVLDGDPDHYHANIFLGLALERQDKFEDAERVYETALKQKQDDVLVWQGLISLYEKQGLMKMDAYSRAAPKLAEMWMNQDDIHKCQVVVDKYLAFAKAHGTRQQQQKALQLILPGSSVYSYLEGRVPQPSATYPKVAELIEADEKQRINKLIGERRTRLGARIGQVELEVKREVFAGSSLEDLYQQIINWTNDDDMRRLYEEKQLQRAYDVLSVLPAKDKKEKLKHVEKLARDFTILNQPFALAWKIALEWKDLTSLGEVDDWLFKKYMELFPNDGLTKVLTGYLTGELSPFPDFELPQPEEKKEDDEENDDFTNEAPSNEEDRLLLITTGAEESSRSQLSQRLLAHYLLHLEEYASAVESSKAALALIKGERQTSGLNFQNNMDAVNTILATSLIHHQTPRYHSEAHDIFAEILKRKPMDTAALIGTGLILEEEENYKGAIDFFTRALKEPNIKVKGELAWCKALDGDHKSGYHELEECLAELEDSETPDKKLRAELLYRSGMCMWNMDPSKSARKDRTKSYSKFLASLQNDPNYAPAYTSLGTYYSDFGKDKKRARKCFQKAFEISPSEVHAAERLARAFADQGEWDLVELVAQRVIDSGKVKPPPGSKKKGISWPFAALGVCQLNKLEYGPAIVSFQSALRISPKDIDSWTGLGESYHNSGRFVAATRAFEHAQELQAESGTEIGTDNWFPLFMLANVRRDLGDFEPAIEGYQKVLELKPEEFGVWQSLLQSHVESAWQAVELGLYGRAAEHAIEAIKTSKRTVGLRSDSFNVWKGVADACAIFTWIPGYASQVPIDNLKAVLFFSAEEQHFDYLAEADEISLALQNEFGKGENLIETLLCGAILASKRAIHYCTSDVHAHAVSWYNLGWIEYRAHRSLADSAVASVKKKAAKHVRTAVKCFKRAIELEARNAEFWNSLGIVTTSLNPKVAQHCFVRSLNINSMEARVWTNLGTFYLLHNENELANEAFTRGQSADPDFAHAWIGQGILALLVGQPQEAYGLFTHAFDISDSSSLITKNLYSSTFFDQMLEAPHAFGELGQLLPPLFALRQLKTQVPDSLAIRHLFSLLDERAGNYTESMESLISVCASVEEEYEVTESEEALNRYAQSKADLSRACLAAEKFDEAFEHAETCLDLSADISDAHSEARAKYRLSAHLTAGLASYYEGEMDRALTMFRTALEESSGSPDAVCVLAQVLWAKGGAREREVAREQLLDCAEAHPEHGGTIALLAVVAALDGDAETLDAVAADLRALRSRADVAPRDKLRYAKLLSSIARLGDGGGAGGEERAEATASVMLAPGQPQGWTQLAALAQGADAFPAEMALLTARGAVPPKGDLGAVDLSSASAGTGRVADAQRAIMVAPWISAGWEVLADNE